MKRVILSILMLVLCAGMAGAATITVDPVNGPIYTIQDGINAAVAGDTVALVAGTFVPAAQVVINKDLTIDGAGAALTVIQPGFNTTTGGYLVTDVLVYVDFGVTATIQNLAVDGTGYTVFTAIQSRGADLTVRNCEVRDVYASIYKGFGISFLTGTGLVENCTLTNIQRVGVQIRGAAIGAYTAPVVAIDGLSFTGKGDGDFLDYGVELGGGGVGTITNSSFTACRGVAATDGSTSAGIYATTYFGAGTTVTITNSTLSGNFEGVTAGYDATDASIVAVHNCVITGNTGSGVVTTSPTVDATENWWGDIDPTDQISGSVDVSPWLGATPGTIPMSWYVDGTSIKAAIAAANGGDSINVAGGTYVEAGQIVIDKDLSLVGDVANRPIVMTDSNTGSSGDPRGWFLQTAGTVMVLKNLELDGTGYDIYQGIRSLGDGLLDNCALRNITYPNYAGVAVAAFGATYFDITNCTFDNIGRVGVLNWDGGTFSGNTYTGKGPGDWLDYAVDTNAGASMTIENNTVTACQGVASTDGSTSAAFLVTTYFGAGTTATINNNILTGNTDGIAVGFDEFDTAVVSGTGNDLSQNDSNGVSNSSLLNSVDFRSNWWGDATGPYHATLNPLGTGSPVGDNILFDPWSGMGAVNTAPATTGPLMCGVTTTLTFTLTTDEYTPDIFGFNAIVRASSEVIWGTITSSGAFGATTQFYTIDNTDGSFAISATTLGNPQLPISGAGDTELFTIEFTTDAQGTAGITFDSMTLRDPANAPIPATGTGAVITVDCTAPAAVTAITAAPRHNKVDVSWTHDGTDVDHYEVFSGVWHDGSNVSAYPEYDDLAGITVPTPPASPAVAITSAEWNAVTPNPVITNTTETWSDQASRGVYYYTVFAVDLAGNISAAPAALDRATNYWLGDVAGTDGTVGTPDITALGTNYGDTVPPGATFNVLDVGPTFDYSRLGIPTTDSVINFEDLMIFSLNFGVVSGAKTKAPLSTIAGLTWVTYDDGAQALRLVSGSGLKGLRVRADVPVGSIEAGQLLDDQSELTFLKNVGQNLDVSVAVMGVNQDFEGSGDLFVVRSESGIKVSDLRITARATDNSELQFTMDEASGTLTPRVFALNANYPNPFNPMTKISFSLPETQDVRLAIYGIDGRKVATLINETRGPGLHEVVWTGRTDDGQTVASGIYFYRIDAGPYSQVKKMTLMK